MFLSRKAPLFERLRDRVTLSAAESTVFDLSTLRKLPFLSLLEASFYFRLLKQLILPFSCHNKCNNY